MEEGGGWLVNEAKWGRQVRGKRPDFAYELGYAHDELVAITTPPIAAYSRFTVQRARDQLATRASVIAAKLS